MFPTIPHCSHTLPEISLEQFEECNEQELNCIFAESGADREPEYNQEGATEAIYLGKDFQHLIRTREAYSKWLNDEAQKQVDAMELFNGQQYDECKGY